MDETSNPRLAMSARRCRQVGFAAIVAGVASSAVCLIWERTGYPPEAEQLLERLFGPEVPDLATAVFRLVSLPAGCVALCNVAVSISGLWDPFTADDAELMVGFWIGLASSATALAVITGAFFVAIWLAFGEL